MEPNSQIPTPNGASGGGVPMGAIPTGPAPMGGGGAPIGGQAPELSQEQMRTNLSGLMSKLEGKNQELNSANFAMDNTIKESKNEALRKVFEIFESKGVDPSDVEAVSEFLNKIKTSDPELHGKIEILLNSILGEEQDEFPTKGTEGTVDEGTMGIPQDEGAMGMGMPQDNMNINNNEIPQENI